MLESQFIPATQGTGRRLMVVLHGLGDSLEGYRWLPDAMGIPWMNYLLVNAPDRYYGGFSWYDLDGDSAPGVIRSRKSLFELFDDLARKNYSPEDTVLLGFSQGCLMSVEMGARYPHCLAGIVGISGYVHQPDKLIQELAPTARRQHFLITHGTQDPLIPIDKVRRQFDSLRDAGLQIDWREFEKSHTIYGELELKVIREFVRGRYA